MAPNPESAAAAVDMLSAQLELAIASLEAIDRKAALVPATLGVVAGIFIAPDGPFTTPQIVALAGALGTGIVSVFFALRALWPRRLSIGPDALAASKGTALAVADFHNAVAGSLAISIGKLAEVAEWKSKRLTYAFWSAGATILLLAVARLAGGIT